VAAARTVAIVPTCGQSARMGRPKLALPLGNRSVIEHVVAALLAGGVETVLIVLGPHVPELEPLARAAGADVLALDHATPDMRATVVAGLNHLETVVELAPDDWWVLAPGDHPVLNAEVVRALLAAASSGYSVVAPVHDGRRGHPTLLRWSLADAVRVLPTGSGINRLLRDPAVRTLEVPVADAGVLTDLDTPDDYERLLRGEH